MFGEKFAAGCRTFAGRGHPRAGYFFFEAFFFAFFLPAFFFVARFFLAIVMTSLWG